MNDQKQHWNNVHTNGNIDHYSGEPTAFAKQVIQILPPSQTVLELGCGAGNDSIGFAQAGHTTIATDFSEVAIKKNAERFNDNPLLTFEVLDISKPLKFNDNMFDVVYARLALHYFTDQTTRTIFDEIRRILKPNGYLCFICKSINDPLYGKGQRIEKDMFENNGHVRHFFSEEYAKSLLANNFKTEKLESGDEKFYGSDSAFVKVIARAMK